MSLLNQVLPEYTVAKRHAIRVAAPPERVFRAVLAHQPFNAPLWRVLFGIRRLPLLLRRLFQGARARGRRRQDGGLVAQVVRAGFVPLGDTADEIVFGLAGQFWRPTGALLPLYDADAFAGAATGPYARAAWNFSVDALADGSSRLSTETRVHVLDPATRRAFLRYWRLVEPFSGLLRQSSLRAIRRAAEGP